jgi:DNA-binding NarL/FixJ family response regulator
MEYGKNRIAHNAFGISYLVQPRKLRGRRSLPTRILLADDDATIRLLLRRLIEFNPDWQVCGDALDGLDAVQKVTQLQPDLVILDLSMPKMNGLDAGREIAKIRPDLPLLMVTVQQIEGPAAVDICAAGFKGAVTKENGAEVVKGVEALLRGDFFFASPSFAASEHSPGSGIERRCI